METPDKKKRPPPIKIPPAPLPLLTPGPNAFALAQKAKREEAERQAKQAASSKPVDAAQPVRACSQRRSDVSAMTSFAQFMQADRNSSPQKVNWPSSVDSRHGSVTTRSQHSHKSHRSMGSTQPLIGHEEEKIYGTDREGEMTRRAAIEDRADQKYLKLVGKHPVSKSLYVCLSS